MGLQRSSEERQEKELILEAVYGKDGADEEGGEGAGFGDGPRFGSPAVAKSRSSQTLAAHLGAIELYVPPLCAELLKATWAAKAREREESKSATERAERARQAAMNQLAYDECRQLWQPLVAASGGAASGGESDGRSEEEVRIGRRVSHRAELGLVMMAAAEVRVVPPGKLRPQRQA